MVAGRIDAGYIIIFYHTHDRLGKRPEFTFICLGTAHIAAETHAVDMTIYAHLVIEPGVETVGSGIIRSIVNVRRKSKDSFTLAEISLFTIRSRQNCV